MKITIFVTHVTVLVLAMIGTVWLGTFLGEVLFHAHDARFLDPKQQVLVTVLFCIMGGVLPFASRIRLAEMIFAAVAVQVLILAVVFLYIECFDWFFWAWVWDVSRIVTVPFAAALGLASLVQRVVMTGHQQAKH